MPTLLDYPALTDRQLVERHLDGDRDAFRQIVERHQAMVCALGFSACGDAARSEDIAQEVFLAAWKQLPELREPEKLRGWLAGIARHMIYSAFRRGQRVPTERGEPLSAALPAGDASPSEQAVRSDETALMWHALAGIPETYREPMVLFYREHQSMAAVAAALEISEELVRQRLVRGRAMLTERMAKLVEETIERSAPTPAFAGAVMLAVPFGVGPAAVLATEAAAAGGKAAVGGTMGKVATAAGAAGGAAAKGGLVFKFLSAVAFLPALLQGAEDFLRFRDRQTGQTAATRRAAAWSYLALNAGIGLFLLGVILPANLPWRPDSPLAYGFIGLVVVSGIWIAVRAKGRLNRLQAGQPSVAAADEVDRGFELRSAGSFLGLPWFHVRLGTRSTRRAPVVKAWIAISDYSAVGGLFAFGPQAAGPVAMGFVSAGVFSIGIVSLGVGALGLAAAGWLSNGLVAVGGHAAKGIFAGAPLVASHNGHFSSAAGEAVARAFFHEHWFYRLTTVSAECFLWAGVLGWVMPVVLTGWSLWRTRATR